MPLPLIPLLAAAPSIFQGITGLFQANRGRRELDNLQRPQYEIPREIEDMLTLSKAQYSDPYSESYLNSTRQVGSAAANAVTAGRDSGNLAAILPSIVGAQNQVFNQANAMLEQTKERQRANLSDMLSVRAKYADQKWQMNSFAPYADQYAEARQQIGGGQANIFGALNGLSSIGQMLLSGRNQQPSPADAAQFTSQQSNQSSMLNGLIQGYSNSASLPNTDSMSYGGQNGIQNRAANQFWWAMNTLGKSF